MISYKEEDEDTLQAALLGYAQQQKHIATQVAAIRAQLDGRQTDESRERGRGYGRGQSSGTASYRSRRSSQAAVANVRERSGNAGQLSRAGRDRIAAAQKKRWADLRRAKARAAAATRRIQAVLKPVGKPSAKAKQAAAVKAVKAVKVAVKSVKAAVKAASKQHKAVAKKIVAAKAAVAATELA